MAIDSKKISYNCLYTYTPKLCTDCFFNENGICDFEILFKFHTKSNKVFYESLKIKRRVKKIDYYKLDKAIQEKINRKLQDFNKSE